jgi:hypothetical protein
MTKQTVSSLFKKTNKKNLRTNILKAQLLNDKHFEDLIV